MLVRYCFSLILCFFSFFLCNFAFSQDLPKAQDEKKLEVKDQNINQIKSKIDSFEAELSKTDDKSLPNSSNSADKTTNPDKSASDPSKSDKKNVILNTSQFKKSLMLSEDEIKQLTEAFQAFYDKKPLKSKDEEKVATEENKEDAVNSNQPKEESRIYLNAIMYISKNNWIVWLNGDKITKENNLPSNPIFIKLVDSNKVSISWSMGLSKWRVLTGKEEVGNGVVVGKDNQIQLNFSLKPNQTYSLLTNKVTEGRNVPLNKPSPEPESDDSQDSQDISN